MYNSFNIHYRCSGRFVSPSVWRRLEGTTPRSLERKAWLSRWFKVSISRHYYHGIGLQSSRWKHWLTIFAQGPSGQKCLQRCFQSQGYREKQRCWDIPGKHDRWSGWVGTFSLFVPTIVLVLVFLVVFVLLVLHVHLVLLVFFSFSCSSCSCWDISGKHYWWIGWIGFLFLPVVR